MPNIFSSGESMLADAFNYASVSISYFRRTAKIAESIHAKVGNTLFRSEDNYGVTIREESRDFIVQSKDLAVVPEVGDEIEQDGLRYLVAAPNGEPCYEYHSKNMSTLRIHCKKFGKSRHA